MSRTERQERRRSAGRRSNDYVGGFTLTAFLIALCGGLVVMYLFFAAIGGFDIGDEPVWTIVVLVLAVVWLAASWQRLVAGGASPRGDRERRGF